MSTSIRCDKSRTRRYRVTSLADAHNRHAGPVLQDFPAPTMVYSPNSALEGPPVSPDHRVYFYSADEWESFILEWVCGLKSDYVQVKKPGGSGDRGADIAAFKSERGFEGAWDCFQAKHYEKALTSANAFPEILKILDSVVDEYYSLPDHYVFVSPKGCGQSLNRLLSQPTRLQQKFLDYLDGNALGAKYDVQKLEGIRLLTKSIDFSMFKSLELHEMLETHRKTRYYSARFGTSLPARPPMKQAPAIPSPNETVYVQKLLDVYREQDDASPIDIESVVDHTVYGQHFQRQREAFYSAEALRLYARDSVPDGTYELLQNDVFTGVIDTAEANYESGLERLRAVLKQVTQLDLGTHKLISVSQLRDRHGICHQLANANKLTWVDSDD